MSYYDHELYQNDLELSLNCNMPDEKLYGKKILITGASGMIGTYMIDLLMKCNELFHQKIFVYALSRDRAKLEKKFSHFKGNRYLQFVERDVSWEFEIEDKEIDFIIHAASNTHPKEYAADPVCTITTNVFGTYYLLEYAKENRNCRLILLSSVEVYGENRGDIEAFDERYCGYIDCNTLRAGYPESKRLSEALLQAYIAKYQVDGCIARLSRTYGPTVETDDSKAISQFIGNAVRGEDIVLKSDGRQLYSYIYVADAVNAVLKVMLEGDCGEAYNVSDMDSDVTLKETAEYIARLVDRKVIYEIPDTDESKGYSTATKALLDAEKLRRLGWKAEYSIQDGLKRTVTILRDISE